MRNITGSDTVLMVSFKNTPSNLISRRGRFIVSRDIIDSASIKLFMFMSRFIIVRAEYYALDNYMEYHAVSALFRSVNEGEIAPFYDFEISSTMTGAITIKAFEVEEDTKIQISSFEKQTSRLLRKLDTANNG